MPHHNRKQACNYDLTPLYDFRPSLSSLHLNLPRVPRESFHILGVPWRGPKPSARPLARPITPRCPTKGSKGAAHLARARVGVVTSVEAGNEFGHRPRAIPLRGRKGAHQRLDLFGERSLALQAWIPRVPPVAGLMGSSLLLCFLAELFPISSKHC